MNGVRHWIVGWAGGVAGRIVMPRFLAGAGFAMGLCGLVYRRMRRDKARNDT